jgi:hypothetical protein
MKRVALLFIFFSKLSIFIFAQSISKNPLTIGLRLHRGYIIPHSDSIASISYSKPYQVEVDASLHLTSQRAYQSCNCFPRVGMSLFYTNFDNRAILGNAYSLLSYIEPYFRADKKFNFSFRLGVGLSYLNNVYHHEKNPSNLFYSAPISFLLMANLSANYKVTPQLMLRLAGNYNHISNGGIQNPNKGINYPTWSLGIDYVFQNPDFHQYSSINWRELHPHRQKWQVAIFGMAKKAFRNEASRYAIVGVEASIHQIVGRLTALSAGVEYIADFSQKENLKRQGKSGNYQSVGLLLGHEFLLGKFTFSQGLGIYLRAYQPELDAVYQRYGISYQVSNQIGVGFNMKVHRSVADFLDCRLIYTLKRR